MPKSLSYLDIDQASMSKGDDTGLGYVSSFGTTIEEKAHVCDLGITLCNSADFNQHITAKVSNLKNRLSWILRTFRTRDQLPMLTLWKQVGLALCEHDYCCQIRSPSRAGEVQALEAAQRAFVKNIRGIQGLSYWQQLKELKLYSLECHRERYIIIYTWRILEGQVPNLECTPILSQWHQRRGRECRVPQVRGSASSSVKQARFSSIAIMGPRLFNSLLQSMRNMTDCNTDTFKRSFDQFLSGIPGEPLIHGYTKYRRCETNSLVEWCASAQLRQLGGAVPESPVLQ